MEPASRLGGNGGGGHDAGLVGPDGGTATASIDLTSVGGVSATVIANGGNGGNSEFGHGGKGSGVSLDSNSCNATSTGGSFIILDAEGQRRKRWLH